MKNVLLVGATGYLGSYILRELIRKGFNITVLVRDKSKIDPNNIHFIDKIVEGNLLDEHTIKHQLQHIDVIISTLGITKQKDKLTYMDVDYGINKMILDEALLAGVKKFIYLSVLHGKNLKNLKICAAKELFVEELLKSDISSTIIRPSGFFSDMSEFIQMAKKGRIYLFGDGNYKANPIDGEDLAKVCVKAIHTDEKEINIGGPEVLSHNELAKKAFQSINSETRISYIPQWFSKVIMKFLYIFTTEKTYGPIEFFLHVMAMDMHTNKYGKKKITDYYTEISKGL
ncbi:MAG: SDR family oxidoreductase [Campylobacterota bacterium]|nr:SDR family oxidoreductase [Campylobacterota bacterium]